MLLCTFVATEIIKNIHLARQKKVGFPGISHPSKAFQVHERKSDTKYAIGSAKIEGLGASGHSSTSSLE